MKDWIDEILDDIFKVMDKHYSGIPIANRLVAIDFSLNEFKKAIKTYNEYVGK